MDFKTLAKFIIILGIVILAYGGFQYATNQPEQFDPSKSERSIFGGRDDVGNWLGVETRNQARMAKRRSATNIMIVGGIVLFIGIGLSASAKKEKVSS